MNGSHEGSQDTVTAGISQDRQPGYPPSAREKVDIMCPACRSEAFYRYGRTRQGKQRFRCLICGRQFTMDRKRSEIGDRPNCPACGCSMHAYKQEHDGIRFRCSAYPNCRTFLKVEEGIRQKTECPGSAEE